jgi:hypothetical protein
MKQIDPDAQARIIFQTWNMSRKRPKDWIIMDDALDLLEEWSLDPLLILINEEEN